MPVRECFWDCTSMANGGLGKNVFLGIGVWQEGCRWVWKFREYWEVPQEGWNLGLLKDLWSYLWIESERKDKPYRRSVAGMSIKNGERKEMKSIYSIPRPACIVRYQVEGAWGKWQLTQSVRWDRRGGFCDHLWNSQGMKTKK